MPAEFDLIRRLRDGAAADPRVPLGIGDDAAVLGAGAGTVVCCDLVAEGTHFTPDTPPELVGRKALAVNLSDLAAMAARPTACFVGLLTDRRRGFKYAERVMAGLCDLAAEFDVTLAGGDTATHDGPTVVTVTALGSADRPLTRCRAKPGDVLLVTGRLGGSFASGRHLTFLPRVAEAAVLAATAELHAMIDLSDGLLADCGRLCEASGVAAVLDGPRVPLQPDAAGLSAALTDGEDFELLFAVSPEAAARLLADGPVSCGLTRVGRVEAGAGVVVTDAAGEPMSFDRPGWEHDYRSVGGSGAG